MIFHGRFHCCNDKYHYPPSVATLTANQKDLNGNDLSINFKVDQEGMIV